MERKDFIRVIEWLESEGIEKPYPYCTEDMATSELGEIAALMANLFSIKVRGDWQMYEMNMFWRRQKAVV